MNILCAVGVKAWTPRASWAEMYAYKYYTSLIHNSYYKNMAYYNITSAKIIQLNE